MIGKTTEKSVILSALKRMGWGWEEYRNYRDESVVELEFSSADVSFIFNDKDELTDIEGKANFYCE